MQVQISEKELDHLRKNHPCLLDQANSYGCVIQDRGTYIFHNLPELIASNLKLAIKD